MSDRFSSSCRFPQVGPPRLFDYVAYRPVFRKGTGGPSCGNVRGTLSLAEDAQGAPATPPSPHLREKAKYGSEMWTGRQLGVVLQNRLTFHLVARDLYHLVEHGTDLLRTQPPHEGFVTHTTRGRGRGPTTQERGRSTGHPWGPKQATRGGLLWPWTSQLREAAVMYDGFATASNPTNASTMRRT